MPYNIDSSCQEQSAPINSFESSLKYFSVTAEILTFLDIFVTYATSTMLTCTVTTCPQKKDLATFVCLSLQ